MTNHHIEGSHPLELLTKQLGKFVEDRHNWTILRIQVERAFYRKSEFHVEDILIFEQPTVHLSGFTNSWTPHDGDRCCNDAIKLFKKRFRVQTVTAKEHCAEGLILQMFRQVTPLPRKHYDDEQIHCRSLKALGTSSEIYSSRLSPELLLKLLTTWSLDINSIQRSRLLPSDPMYSVNIGLPQGNVEELMDFFGHVTERLEGVMSEHVTENEV